MDFSFDFIFIAYYVVISFYVVRPIKRLDSTAARLFRHKCGRPSKGLRLHCGNLPGCIGNGGRANRGFGDGSGGSFCGFGGLDGRFCGSFFNHYS